LYLLILI